MSSLAYLRISMIGFISFLSISTYFWYVNNHDACEGFLIGSILWIVSILIWNRNVNHGF